MSSPQSGGFEPSIRFEYELVNLKTAKVLGRDIPNAALFLADGVGVASP
jgi:hypothetical protein